MLPRPSSYLLDDLVEEKLQGFNFMLVGNTCRNKSLREQFCGRLFNLRGVETGFVFICFSFEDLIEDC